MTPPHLMSGVERVALCLLVGSKTPLGSSRVQSMDQLICPVSGPAINCPGMLQPKEM